MPNYSGSRDRQKREEWPTHRSFFWCCCLVQKLKQKNPRWKQNKVNSRNSWTHSWTLIKQCCFCVCVCVSVMFRNATMHAKTQLDHVMSSLSFTFCNHASRTRILHLRNKSKLGSLYKCERMHFFEAGRVCTKFLYTLP